MALRAEELKNQGNVYVAPPASLPRLRLLTAATDVMLKETMLGRRSCIHKRELYFPSYVF
jgi:hypothetical protein